MEEEMKEKLEEESVESKIVNLDRTKSNIERESENAKKQVPQVQLRKDILLEEKSVNDANDIIVQANFVLFEPKWGFEKIPEYIENVRKLNALSAQKRTIEYDDSLDKINRALELLAAQIKGYDEELIRIEDKKKELEGE